MQNLKILNSKEIKLIYKLLEKQFNFSNKLNYIFLKDKNDKIFLLSDDFKKLDTKPLYINNLGLYFGKIEHSSIRLTIEGSQLIGPYSSKNILNINNQQLESFLKGNNLEINSDLNDYVLIKCKNDFIGCGKLKNNLLLNFLPKERRLKSIS